jgi:ABC-type nickel/cobalt efflux system permease component RcnA
MMKFISYFLLVLIMAFSGWANARPQKPDCMMKEMAHVQAQQQHCDEAMPACGDQHHASSKPCCKLTVDCQSSSLGVVAILLNVLPPPSETVYHSTSDSPPLSSAHSNVWRPPARG